MKRKLGLLLTALVACLAWAGIALAANSVYNCQSVNTSSVQILPFNNNRVSWTILTTAGSPAAVYWSTSSPATVQGANSLKLQPGGATYTNDAPEEKIHKGTVFAISAAGGPVWVCTIETVQ